MNTESPEAVLTCRPAPGISAHRGAAVEASPSMIHLENILVPLDLSEMSLESLEYAVPLARQFGAKITLLHVVEPPAYAPELPCSAPLAAEHCAAVVHQLETLSEERIPDEVEAAIAVRHNFVFDGIIEVAWETRAGLIIITTHGHTGLKHLLAGSTAENVVRQAPCPVLVVRKCEHGGGSEMRAPA